jgi:NDP-sugar pyrophosphorylase family protein
MDIGTPQKYLEANLDALSGRYRTDAVPAPAHGLIVADEGARVAGGARVSSSCLGAGAVVGAAATVVDSVLLPRAEVGEGATVARAILGEGASVAPGGRAVDVALGDGGRITRS